MPTNEFLKLEPSLRNNDFVVELPEEIKVNFENLKEKSKEQSKRKLEE